MVGDLEEPRRQARGADLCRDGPFRRCRVGAAEGRADVDQRHRR